MRADFKEKLDEMDTRQKAQLERQTRDHREQLNHLRHQQLRRIADLKQESDRNQMESDQSHQVYTQNREAKFRERVKNMETQHARQLARLNESYQRTLSELMRKGRGL